MQVETTRSAIRQISDVSVESSASDIARLALRHLQDAVVTTLYHRPPPKNSRLLNLGCGDSLYEGWVNADRFRTGYWLVKLGGVIKGQYRLPDWVLDAAARWNCPDDHWEGIYTEHMLEHLSYRQGVQVMREMLRTLQPGAWARVIVPDLGRYIAFCAGDRSNDELNARFSYGAEAVSFLTQNFGHVSTWDGTLLEAVLSEVGFVNVRVVSYGEGTDRRLIHDSSSRAWESVYVEAQKPGRSGIDIPESRPLAAAYT